MHVTDIDEPAAARVAREIGHGGGSTVAHRVDVSDPDAVEGLAEAVFAADRAVDILHNNAGIGHAGNIEATTVGDWQRVIAVNLLGVAYGIQASVPRMLAQGRTATVVNTTSEAGLVPMARMAPYCASKYGVVGLSESLNAELAKRGIRVIAICPGVINTQVINSGILRGDIADVSSQASAFYAKYGASPDTVAEAVLKAVKRPKLIVAVPRSHVLGPYLLRRISPALIQPLARNFTRIMSLG